MENFHRLVFIGIRSGLHVEFSFCSNTKFSKSLDIGGGKRKYVQLFLSLRFHRLMTVSNVYIVQCAKCMHVTAEFRKSTSISSARVYIYLCLIISYCLFRLLLFVPVKLYMCVQCICTKYDTENARKPLFSSVATLL